MWNLRGEDKLHLPCKTQDMVIYAAHLFPFVKPIGFDNHVCHVDVIASGSDIQRCFSLLQLEGEKWAGKDLTRSGGSISMPTWQSNSRQHSPLSVVPSCNARPLFSTCKHCLRCELTSRYCVQDTESHFPGSAASPLLPRGGCQFSSSGCHIL